MFHLLEVCHHQNTTSSLWLIHAYPITHWAVKSGGFCTQIASEEIWNMENMRTINHRIHGIHWIFIGIGCLFSDIWMTWMAYQFGSSTTEFRQRFGVPLSLMLETLRLSWEHDVHLFNHYLMVTWGILCFGQNHIADCRSHCVQLCLRENEWVWKHGLQIVRLGNSCSLRHRHHIMTMRLNIGIKWTFK